MNNRRYKNHNDRYYDCGNYDIFVRERRNDYDRYDCRNHDECARGASFLEVIALIIGFVLLFISFNG